MSSLFSIDKDYIYDFSVTAEISRPELGIGCRRLPRRASRSRARIVSFRRARSCEMSCANRYVLINAPLPHSPGAITAIITGPRIFSARGLHALTYTYMRMGRGGKRRRDYSVE